VQRMLREAAAEAAERARRRQASLYEHWRHPS
jgi:hypothetical protein